MPAQGSSTTEKYVNLDFEKTIISIFPRCLIKVRLCMVSFTALDSIKIEYACMFIGRCALK